MATESGFTPAAGLSLKMRIAYRDGGGGEDETDQQCHFVLQRGKKLLRKNGHRTEIGSPETLQAASRVEDSIQSGAIGDVESEPLKFFLQDEVFG